MKKVSKEQYLKYKKPNNCSYPFQMDGIDYCWGYALMVDKETESKMDCTGCEYFKGEPNE